MKYLALFTIPFKTLIIETSKTEFFILIEYLGGVTFLCYKMMLRITFIIWDVKENKHTFKGWIIY